MQLKLLESSKDKLDDVISKCKIAEMAITNRSLLSGKEVKSVNEVEAAAAEMSIDAIRGHPFMGKQSQKCYRCGGVYSGQHQRFCPAMKEGAKCNKCGGAGHFQSVCRSNAKEPALSYRGQQQRANRGRVNELQYSLWENTGEQLNQNRNSNMRETNSDKKFIHRINERANGWFKRLMVGGLEVEFKLDTGADISCLPIDIIHKLKLKNQLSISHNQLYAYNNEKINSFGQIKLNCIDFDTQKRKEILFEVVDIGFQPILSREACVEMNLLQRTSINMIRYESKEQFVDHNRAVFEGLGEIPGECSIMLKDNAVPHLKYRKRIPDSLHNKLREQLSSMEKEGIISPVNYLTDWVNNLQIVEKPNGAIRLCLDPTALNSCIRREHFLIPTAEAIISRLANKRVFSVLDLKNGFWQLQLDRKNSDLTTFMTPFGRYRWNRVPFGINSAPELFMKSMVRIFGDIPNVEIYFDDIFISGSTIEEHDATMELVLSRARENNIKFNSEKIQYRSEEVKFMGQVIRKNVVMPDSKYSDAIMELTVPKNKTDVMRLLGMLKFLARFIPNLTSKSAHLRELTKIESPWSWEESHQREFDDLKGIICQRPALRIFDPKLPLVIQTDASKNGLGCVLMQNDQPIAFGSRSLTSSEQKWAQIEKELLAIVFACEKFHHFIYGRSVVIQSDHKPLETLVKKELDEVTVRLQRMFLILLKYPGIEVRYTPGKQLLIADCLSRASRTDTGIDNEELKYVIHVVKKRICVSKDNYDIYVSETQRDYQLQELIGYIEGEWPSQNNIPSYLQQFRKVKDELKFEEGLLFMNDKLIVPESLRAKLVAMLHESHFGIEKTLARARQLFYWPGISADIKAIVKNCHICEKYLRNNCGEPLVQESNPEYPWQKVSMDIYEYMNKSYIVLIDAYSGWICSEKIPNKSIDSVINYLERTFNSHGYPTEIRTDNGPFNSKKFLQFASKFNIVVKFSSPNYPQSNGLAEKAVAIAKSIVKKAIDENKSHEFAYRLLEYNTTPIPSMGISPCQLFMGRLIKTKLPVMNKQLIRQSLNEEELQQKFTLKKEKQKNYYDRQKKRLLPLVEGDKVMFKKTANEWVYGVVTDIVNDRSYIIKTASNNFYRRNRRSSVHCKIKQLFGRRQ